MVDKKEMMNKKKYDGFAIASFVLGIIILTMLPIYLIARFEGGASVDFDIIFSPLVVLLAFIFFLSPLISILSIIFGTIGLKRIKRNDNVRGKNFALIGIIISVLCFLLDFILLIMIMLGRIQM